MLCAKYQEAGLCGSREKCDRNYLVSKFAYVHNIQSRVKQEVDMPQIQNCISRYSSPYWCSVPNIRKLASVVPEKNVTEIILLANLLTSTIFSRVKQEVDMPQIQNCVTRYSSPYWCSVPNIRKLACVVPQKNVTEIFCDADDDNSRRQKWSLYVASVKAGRRHKNIHCSFIVCSPFTLRPCLRSVAFRLRSAVTHRSATCVQRSDIVHSAFLQRAFTVHSGFAHGSSGKVECFRDCISNLLSCLFADLCALQCDWWFPVLFLTFF